MAATPEAAIPVDSDGNVSWLELGRHGLPHCVWRETYECKGSVEIPRRKQILADMGHLVQCSRVGAKASRTSSKDDRRLGDVFGLLLCSCRASLVAQW